MGTYTGRWRTVARPGRCGPRRHERAGSAGHKALSVESSPVPISVGSSGKAPDLAAGRERKSA